MPSTPVAIMLIDANKLFRQALRCLFDGQDFMVMAEAASVAEAELQAAGGVRADLVLVDPMAANSVERDAVGRMRAVLPDARILVLTGELDSALLADTLKAGGDGYLLKDLSADALNQSLRLVMTGEKVFPSHLAALLLTSGNDAIRSGAGQRMLSERETQILHGLASGRSNKAIARDLEITEATVKVHLRSLLRKINAANRTQAAVWALSHGIGPAALNTAIA